MSYLLIDSQLHVWAFLCKIWKKSFMKSISEDHWFTFSKVQKKGHTLGLSIERTHFVPKYYCLPLYIGAGTRKLQPWQRIGVGAAENWLGWWGDTVWRRTDDGRKSKDSGRERGAEETNNAWK